MTDEHPPYWFFHEYRDEAARHRVHKVTAESEREARRLHRQACEFLWVTQHVDPSVSSLFRQGDRRSVAIQPGRRPGEKYGGEEKPVPMPDHVHDQLARYLGTHEDNDGTP